MLAKQRNFLRLRHAKAHDDGTLKNPFFLRAKTSFWIKAITLLLVLCAGIGGGIWATYLPILQIENITVQGTTILDPHALKETMETVLKQKKIPLSSYRNIYLVRTKKIEEALLTSHSVEHVSVHREGRSFVITVQEKITTVVLRTKEKTVMLDVDGKYVRDASTEESRAIDIRIGTAAPAEHEAIVPLQADMPIVLNTQNDPVTELSSSTTHAMLTLSHELGTSGFRAIAYTIDGLAAPFVRVNTDAEYDLYFDLFARSVEEQIRALNAILAQDGFAPPSEYIDLRFGAYVYMK